MPNDELVLERGPGSEDPVIALTALGRSMRVLMEARNLDTSEHALRVTSMALAVLERMDPIAAADPTIALAYDMHDIGKATTSDAVLLKNGPLTADEWEEMRLHVMVGANIVEAIEALRGSRAARIIRHHHERWDGSGYPHGLSGDAIPIECRAFSVVDAFDAMTNDRPYRRAIAHADAVEELRRHSGTQFEPRAIDAFEDVLQLWASQPQITKTW